MSQEHIANQPSQEVVELLRRNFSSKEEDKLERQQIDVRSRDTPAAARLAP